MILSAQSIDRRCQTSPRLLEPYFLREVIAGTSRGLGPCGYDLSLVLKDDAPEHWLHPGGFLLAAAAEKFTMPSDLMGRVCDKSTWARRGLSVFNTVIEPGWRGWLTLELVNHGAQSLRLVSGQGIAQVIFEQLDQPTDLPYPEDGKYQDQDYGPVEARR